MTRADRLARLDSARLYLVTPLRPGGQPLDDILAAALGGGVDIVQLRDKEADDEALLAAARIARRRCDEHGALLILNDRPELVGPSGADGCHVGQDDLPVAAARELAGPDALVGLSTHAADQFAAATALGADYAGVGPVYATPTKPGRPAAGLEYVTEAGAHRSTLPWFAIGGIDVHNADDVVAAGARRIAVVRAITEAADPRAAAAALCDALPAPTARRAPIRRQEALHGAA